MSTAAPESRGLLVLEPAGPGMRPVRLPPLYYLHNFRRALSTLRERYDGLLSGDEAHFIDRFNALQHSTQCLLTRLLMRKGPLFRRATLQYVEVTDLDTSLHELVGLGWVDPDPRLSPAELARALRRSCRERVPVHETQLALPLPDRPTIQRPLSAWNPRLAGCVVRLLIDSLVRRLQQLFFGNHYQSWSEFVLTDLGVKRYESVLLDADARAFGSREEIEHFYRLNECRARLDAGEPPGVVLERAAVPQNVSGWLRSRFLHLCFRIGELLEEQGLAQQALGCYRECASVEGLVRAVRLQERLGRLADAERDAVAAQGRPCSEAQQEALERVLSRLQRRRGAAPARRSAQDRTELIELLLPPLAHAKRIEIAVIGQLSQPGSQLFYVENSLLSSLFGLLCWEAIFAPITGAFFHPFQAAPADLYTAQFRARRARHFTQLLGLLETGQHEAQIWRLYRAKVGISTGLVHWGRLTPGLLKLALQCIPARDLGLCFERLLDDLQENMTGMPDLIQFWPAQNRYRLIEVKGPGDRLQHNQRRWLTFFARNGIPAAVCRVRFD